MSQRPKILVVDDLATNRLAIRMALKGIDATIVEASNGFDALSIALDEEFALILLDVQMPEMDGFEVCERLAANPQTAETPVIFVTAAHNANEDRLHGYLRGATDYLSKPINDQILRAKTLVFLRLYQQNRALQAALEAAKVADRVKDAFLANVSHELRTPLNAVIGLSALALNSSTEPRQREYLEKVSDAGQTLLAIINDLLDLTKIAAGEMTFEATPFSLRKTAARALSVLGHHAAEKGLPLSVHIDERLPEVLVGDPLRIEQILLNLLNNAIKFTDSGRIVVRITLESSDEQRAHLLLEVEDSGIGMSDDEIAHIYQPFVQADPSITRKHGGTGLGLAICKQLAEGMHGSIEVSSRPGAGTVFRVRLTLGCATAGELPSGEDPADGEPLPNHYRGAQVLVVDDQALNREIVFDLLGTVGIVPRLAENGQAAIDILNEAGAQAFDLVLMDIQMPVLDGLAATRRIRALPGFATLPIVAMTAHTMVHEKQVYLAEGMNDHLGKPFSLPNFFALLARWLAHRVAPLPSTAGPPLAATDGGDAAEHRRPRQQRRDATFCRQQRALPALAGGIRRRIGEFRGHRRNAADEWCARGGEAGHARFQGPCRRARDERAASPGDGPRAGDRHRHGLWRTPAAARAVDRRDVRQGASGAAAGAPPADALADAAAADTTTGTAAPGVDHGAAAVARYGRRQQCRRPPGLPRRTPGQPLAAPAPGCLDRRPALRFRSRQPMARRPQQRTDTMNPHARLPTAVRLLLLCLPLVTEPMTAHSMEHEKEVSSPDSTS
jgi:signal transduction histidine kinase